MQILSLAYALVCIFGAAVVRGYSGFGFSLLAIVSLSLLLPPMQIVPSIFIMEVAASLHLLPGVWRDIHWRALRWLTIGSLVGTPFGVYALAHVPAAPMTLALAVFVLLATILLARGFALQALPGNAVTFATGTASGLFNGGFGIGGPPVILFFFSSPAGAAAGRASMIAYFLMTDLTGLAWQGWNGLLNVATLWRALSFLPALAGGLWLGNRGFLNASPIDFRRWVLRLLMLLAVLTGARALNQIL
ncbi:MAG TPA: sulfite exporter TauE/SafE family protein [Steroidobacteraceae bacterium]|nr:sulfite exporter TauE/SafE family protein [Steroidobacteraceae bacterium]